MSEFDWLVVGAGLTGATLAERIASQLGQSVLVVDRRPHIAGNVYDELDGDGIRVHRYGAHIFHTSSERVWSYLSRFTTWVGYEHRVLASVGGRLVPLPFNLNTLDMLFPAPDAAHLTGLLVNTFGESSRVPVLKLIDHPTPELSELGRFVYDQVFLNYTAKQWGRRPEELDPSVTGRVPVLVSRDDRYFRDKHQALPAEGYTTMVARMLDHPLITVATSTDYAAAASSVKHRRVVYTGPIDEYFFGVYGPLPYRSLRFEHERLPTGPHQPVSVVNYPNEHDYTRILEHRHFAGGSSWAGASTITREYPDEYRPGDNEPFYPLPAEASHQAYRRYADLRDETEPDTVFAGRLAKYRYLDMDQAVNLALQAFDRRICCAVPA